MNKFNIGDEVVYKISGKVDNIMECAPGQILYQLETQNKDYWLKEEDLSFAGRVKSKGNMKRYRKKPVEVEAMQFTRQNIEALRKFTQGKLHTVIIPKHIKGIMSATVDTLEGSHTATENDYIIRGVKGKFYPCKPDIFKMTYDSTE